MKKVVIVNAIRTPIGKVGGLLSSVQATKMAAAVMKEAVKRACIDSNEVDEVIFGNLMNFDYNNVARFSWLEAGLSVDVPATTVNKRCASSLSALVMGAMMIQTGNADIVLTGGTESYSQNPIMLKRPEKAYPLNLQFLNTRQAPASLGNISLLETAEKIAEKYNISRKECDEFSVRSHRLAAQAWETGAFKEQLIPINTQRGEGNGEVYRDECIRDNCSIDGLSKLKALVKADGVVTAGNSSPMNDGASALMIMSEEKAISLGLEPIAVVKDYATVGCDPNYMGIGPVLATKKLFDKTGYSMKDVDLIEINEAFASQSLACLREMDLANERDMKRINVNGGAIALGHPNAASGGILTARLIYELRKRNLKRGLVTFCAGGGQGFSLILENYL